jgi:hypothetical protein
MGGRQIRATVSVVMAGCAATCALAACGSSSAPTAPAAPARSSPTTAASPARSSGSSTPANTAASATSPATPALTQPGSTLRVGQPATIDFNTTLKNGSTGPDYTFKLTIESITPGSMADFKGISLTGVPKGSSPTYVTVRIVNVGRHALRTSVGDPTYSVGAIEGDGVDGDLSLTGYFPKCPQTDSPNAFVPGRSFRTCQIFMEHGNVTRVGYDGSESTIDTPIIWTAR